MNTQAVQEEMALLRSLAISIVGKDKEGTYRPSFVRQALRNARERPTRRFTSAKTLFAEIERA